MSRSLISITLAFLAGICTETAAGLDFQWRYVFAIVGTLIIAVLVSIPTKP